MNLNGAWDISGNLRSANLLPFKGGLISEIFADSNLPKKVPNHYTEKMLRIVIWHLFFGHLRQNEKPSEINPLLKTTLVMNR